MEVALVLLMLFALLAGSALGVRQRNTLPLRGHKGPAVASLVAALLLWITAAMALVIPISDAESLASGADEQIRTQHPERAAASFAVAFNNLPYNADYAYRGARALAMSGAAPEKVRAALKLAIGADAVQPQYWLMLASFEAMQNPPDAGAVVDAYERALAIDPNNVSGRIEFADALQKLGRHPQAVEQYRRALEINDQFEPADPKRLSVERVLEINAKIRS